MVKRTREATSLRPTRP